MIIGYARVSTEEQNLSLQLIALKAAQCTRIFVDQGISGTLHSRPGLDRALKRVRPGGKLVVWRLDRLGRSLVHLVQLLDDLGHRNVSFHSITECIDTDSSGGRLMFHIMAALAEFERGLISERTRAGMAAARAMGKPVGRPRALTPEQELQARELLDQRALNFADVARQFGVHPRTLIRTLAQTQRDDRPAP